jgi:methylisocitrate lyase
MPEPENATPGQRLRSALTAERPLQMVGTINAYVARMAEAVGYRALYLSGGGLAANTLGLPDLGISTMHDVAIEIGRITAASSLPLLVDADTGWGGALSIARTVQCFIREGAAGLHIEDQVQSKRCGHRPGKQIVSKDELVDRIKAAVDARSDASFVIMARSDALASEGEGSLIERLQACIEAGADMVFPEAVTELAQYQRIRTALGVPVLANLTEFGRTPLFTREQLGAAGVDIALYCCAVYRAMNAAALKALQGIRRDGTQAGLVDEMQTREQLYQFLDYHRYEQQLDALFVADKAR